MKKLLRDLLLIAAFLTPAGIYVDNAYYLTKASIAPVVPTEQSIQAAESVVGIQSAYGFGSATHIGDGLFVSAHHVVEGAEDQPIAIVDHHLQVIYSGHVKIYNVDYDLVIIKADKPEAVITPAAPVAWDDAKEGDTVHGVGFGVSYSDNKEGCERRIWSGTVTDFSINIGGSQPNCLQSTNPAIPGDSGGALFNDKGELLGVIHATDYIHTYSIRNACIHQLLRRLEHAEQS